MSSFRLNLIKTEVLKAAAAHVPHHGFSCHALELGIDDALHRTEGPSKELLSNCRHSLRHMFARGPMAALVEHFVQSSNAAARELLLSKYDARMGLESFESVENVPLSSVIAGDALSAKIGILIPVLHHWPAAVRLELMPENAPIALKSLCEFCDDVVYHCERMKSVRGYLDAETTVIARLSRSARAPAIIADGIRNSRKDCVGEYYPLSRGPHLADGAFGVDWYLKRAQVGAAYLAAVTSAIGECNGKPVQHVPSSLQLARSLVASL
jgi:hypothetical protein